ncbi:hypothetical protein H4R24_000513 [Coemansia sp. RSA 988]|nr:hypothetical protein H4R24_000513 [Coemansia sp. RSA 988]
MLLSNDEFLASLTGLFTATRDAGSVSLTVKRCVKQERQKKRARRDNDEEAIKLLIDQMSLDEKEYATLVRAATDKKKISTLVTPADLDVFLARYHGLLLIDLESIKRNDRLRRKKAAIKRGVAKKMKSKKDQQREKKPKSAV